MNDLIVVPTWKEKELVIPYEFFKRKFICKMIAWDINNMYDLKIAKTSYYEDIKMHINGFKITTKGNRYNHKCLRKYIVLMNQGKEINNYISGIKQARLIDEYNIPRFVTTEVMYEKNAVYTYGIKIIKIKECYISFLLQKKLDKKLCELLQREFNNISSNADNISFDNYIDSWAKRLLIESMVKPDGL